MGYLKTERIEILRQFHNDLTALTQFPAWNKT